MKRLMYVTLCVSLGMVLCGTAIASPAIDSAVINTRIFNDDPTSTLTTTNSYASSITINDTPTGVGWANLHNFLLSDDGGSTAASFANGDPFSFASDVSITGQGISEAGLLVSPWWSLNVDGRYMINGSSGEIACFGGRLPFYSFTADQGLSYTKGDTVRMGVIYNPHALNMSAPATIEYLLTMAGTDYTSGAIAFDQGNPAEGHGEWGMLTPAGVGGYFQIQTGNSGAGNWEQATFGDMVYSPVPEPATMALLGLGSLFLVRRRK